MGLKIEQREKEGITILDCQGDMTFGENDLAFREKLEGLLASGTTRLILNLKGVNRIDSSSLGTLVTMSARFQKTGGKMVLLDLNQAQLELLIMGKLEIVFELFDDEQEAVNSFFPGRTIRHFDVLAFVRRQEKERSGT